MTTETIRPTGPGAPSQPVLARWPRWLLVAALLCGLAPLAAPRPAEAAVAISRVTVTNVTDASFTISWVTNAPVEGYVQYGDSEDLLSSRADDTRGSGYVGYVHYVEVISRLAGTTYYYSVHSGDAILGRDTPLSVKTGLTPTEEPPAPTPNNFAGTVYKSDGVTPAPGVIVYAYLQHVPESGSSTNSARMSALTDAEGAFEIDVSRARVATSYEKYFPYDLDGDNVLYQVDGGPSNLLSQQSVDTNTTSEGTMATEVEVSLLNPDPATPTPTSEATTPTPNPIRTSATPSPTPTQARTPRPTIPPSPTAEPTARVVVAPSPTPPPPAVAAPVAVPTAPASPTSTATQQPSATPTPGFFRPPPPVGGSRPSGVVSAGYVQRGATPSPEPAASAPPPATDSGLPTTDVTPSSNPSVVPTVVLLAAVLLAVGLGLVTMGVVAGLRRRAA